MNVLEAPREVIAIMVDAAWDVDGLPKKIFMEDVDVDGWSPRKKDALKLSTHKYCISRKKGWRVGEMEK